MDIQLDRCVNSCHTRARLLPCQLRHVIHAKLFLGWTDNQCVPDYNGYNGSNVTIGSSILKKINVEAGKWFLEEGVVLSW